jgi:hypothetical protein
VRTKDLEFVSYLESFETGGAFFEDGQIGFAAEQDAYAGAQRSSSSIASSAISVRYCMPSKCIRSTAA